MSPKSPRSVRKSIVRKGYYFRKDGSKRIPRFFCRVCRKSFSSAYFHPTYRQKKRTFNSALDHWLNSGGTQRRAALVFTLNRKTIVRKFLFLSEQAVRTHAQDQETRKSHGSEPDLELVKERKKIREIQFDEIRSSVWSKCLPVSILLMVSTQREILGFRVAKIPANGPLAEISRRKYGPRKDERDEKARELFCDLAPRLSPDVTITSDRDMKYPHWVTTYLPQARHVRVKGRRGCVAGQGELKKTGFDPLFSLNHTAAMMRANIHRLIRRTWSTSKRIDRLTAHLQIYMRYHNNFLLQNPAR